jgi:seryl-tRNA synthetase
MTTVKYFIIGLIIDCMARFNSAGQQTTSLVPVHDLAESGATIVTSSESDVRADRHYDEMLGKMQTAVEEVAQLYGNPLFLQVFTNDPERARELKEILKADRRTGDLQLEVDDLEKKRDELLDDIALKERQTKELRESLARQKLALDTASSAIEQAKRAVEGATK